MERISAFYRRYSVAGPVATAFLLSDIIKRIFEWVGVVDQLRSMMDPNYWLTQILFWPHLSLVISCIGLIILALLIIKQEPLVKVPTPDTAEPINQLRYSSIDPSAESWSVDPSEDRIPYIEIREIANDKGWKLDDDKSLSGNRAYDLEMAMRQAVTDGTLSVWGRKHGTPIETNPLLLIPKEHFQKFEFRHGCLNYDNFDNVNTYTRIPGKDSNIHEGDNYCDLHVSKRDIERLLGRLTPTTGKIPQ